MAGAESVVNRRVYCSVYGCLNSSLMKPTLSFFQLPTDDNRRSEWLRLMSREDLTQKTPQCYKVCEEHFNEQDILPGPQRKKLKKKALPTLNLPDLLKKDGATQTIDLTHTCQSVQTERIFPTHKTTQTTQLLSHYTPCMRKLKSELSECRKKITLNESGVKSRNVKKGTFHSLCDNFLTKELAMIVKANTDLKVHSQGNRYDEEYITFCLNVYNTSPEAYRLLQSSLCMPCPSTLSKIKTKKTDNSETMIICKIENDS